MTGRVRRHFPGPGSALVLGVIVGDDFVLESAFRER